VASSNCCRLISIRMELPRWSQATAAFSRATASASRLRIRATVCRPTLNRRADRRRVGGELLRHEIDKPLVPIVAAQPDVAVGGQGVEPVPRICITVTSNVPPPRS